MTRITHGEEMHRDTAASGPFEDHPSAPGLWRFKTGEHTLIDETDEAFLRLEAAVAELGSGTDETLFLTANLSTPGGADAAKIIMLGGHGLVIPILSADPAAGASEDGQIYYNDTADKIRLRANGAWTDIGGGGGSGIAGELVTDTIIGDGVEDTFTLSAAPTGSWALVSTNGADLLPTEYAISGGDIIFDVAPANLSETLVTFIAGGFTVPAVDPGDIADPTLATAEDVANKLNDLMAELRTAGMIA